MTQSRTITAGGWKNPGLRGKRPGFSQDKQPERLHGTHWADQPARPQSLLSEIFPDENGQAATYSTVTDKKGVVHAVCGQCLRRRNADRPDCHQPDEQGDLP